MLTEEAVRERGIVYKLLFKNDTLIRVPYAVNDFKFTLFEEYYDNLDTLCKDYIFNTTLAFGFFDWFTENLIIDKKLKLFVFFYSYNLLDGDMPLLSIRKRRIFMYEFLSLVSEYKSSLITYDDFKYTITRVGRLAINELEKIWWETNIIGTNKNLIELSTPIKQFIWQMENQSNSVKFGS